MAIAQRSILLFIAATLFALLLVVGLHFKGESDRAALADKAAADAYQQIKTEFGGDGKPWKVH